MVLASAVSTGPSLVNLPSMIPGAVLIALDLPAGSYSLLGRVVVTGVPGGHQARIPLVASPLPEPIKMKPWETQFCWDR